MWYNENMKNWRGRIYPQVLLAVAIIMLPCISLAANLNDLIDQKNQLNDELNKNQAAADNKAKEANALSNQITSLESNIKTTEGKIADTSTKIDETNVTITQLASDIDKKTAELNELKRKLNNAIVEVYRSASRSDWELLFGASSLSESANQMKYIETIETQVKIVHQQVTAAKQDLEKKKGEQEGKKAELDQLQNQQVAYKKSAEYQVTQKDKLRSMTLDQQKEYEAQVEKLQSEITHISSQIYAERQKRLSGGKESLLNGSSSYPYTAIDEPDAFGFLTRECTSYAAWYWNVLLGKDWTNTRPGSGSAYNWPALAADQGYNVSSTAKVGAIISWGASSLTSSWGHVAIVEAVNSDGTIDVSEYNWLKYDYSYRSEVTPSDYGSYSYIY